MAGDCGSTGDKDLGLIQASDPNGGNRELSLSDPRGIAVDTDQEKIFWAVHEVNGAIWWADCDGTNAEVFIGSLDEPADLELDSENGVIYWISEGSGQIQKANLDDGREVTVVLSGLNQTLLSRSSRWIRLLELL